MKYREALEYAESCRVYGVAPGLETIRELLARLGNPERKLKLIHVAGTNGKGSVVCMISSVLAAAGYRTGRYISPVLSDYREQFEINGRMIGKAELGRYMEILRDAAESMTAEGLAHPTPFEMGTALAFLWFRDKKCDLAVVETGMGGLLDATNVIPPPLLCVLTSISMDHMAALGETPARIAAQKAGIIKPGSSVVSIMQQPEVMAVIEETCERLGCPLDVASVQEAKSVRMSPERTRLSWNGYKNLLLPLAGSYQVDNCVLALHALRILAKLGFGIPEEKLRTGLAAVQWHGRFEVLGKKPLFVADGAHNEDGARRLSESLHLYFADRRIILITGILQDKQADRILEQLCVLAAAVITVTAGPNPRGMPAVPALDLAERAKAYHGNVTAADSLEEAVEMAYLLAGEEDVILACGSLSFQGELMRIVKSLL